MHIVNSLVLGAVAGLHYQITRIQRVDPGLTIIQNRLIQFKKCGVSIDDQTVFKKCFVNRFRDAVEDEQSHAYIRQLPKIKTV